MSRTENATKWIKSYKKNSHKRKALESASTNFNESDNLTVNTLEAIYGQESSFGNESVLDKDVRGASGAVGHFQIEKTTAGKRMRTLKSNDERFDIDQSSHFAAGYLKRIDNSFSKKTYVYKEGSYGRIYTTPISNSNERRLFDVASYNAGLKRIAIAQIETSRAGMDPEKWSDVKDYLAVAGANEDKVKEIIEYVDNVMFYEKIFREKSSANKDKKYEDSALYPSSDGGHWVTLDDGRRIMIGN